MTPKKKAVVSKPPKKKATAKVPSSAEPESSPSTITTDFMAGHLFSMYNQSGCIDRHQFMRLLHGHEPSPPPLQPQQHAAPLLPPQVASTPPPPPPPPPQPPVPTAPALPVHEEQQPHSRHILRSPSSSLSLLNYQQQAQLEPAPLIEVMADDVRLSVEAHLLDYSRVSSLLQGAKNRYFLLDDKSGSNVELVKRLLSEKRLLRDMLRSDVAMIEGVCANLYQPPVIDAVSRVAVHQKLLELGRKCHEIIMVEDKRQKQMNERQHAQAGRNNNGNNRNKAPLTSSSSSEEQQGMGVVEERGATSSAWATERRVLYKQLQQQDGIIGELRSVLAESLRSFKQEGEGEGGRRREGGGVAAAGAGAGGGGSPRMLTTLRLDEAMLGSPVSNRVAMKRLSSTREVKAVLEGTLKLDDNGAAKAGPHVSHQVSSIQQEMVRGGSPRKGEGGGMEGTLRVGGEGMAVRGGSVVEMRKVVVQKKEEEKGEGGRGLVSQKGGEGGEEAVVVGRKEQVTVVQQPVPAS